METIPALREYVQLGAKVTPAGPISQLLAKLCGPSTRARYARAVGWSFVGVVASQGLTLVGSMVVARMLGITGFGELGMIQSTVGMFGVFAGAGMGMTATKYVAELRDCDPDRAGHVLSLTLAASLVVSSFVALLLFTTAPLVAKSINAPHLDKSVEAAAFLLFFTALNSTQTAALAGFESFRSIAGLSIVRGIANFCLAIVGATLWQLTGALWGLVAATAVTCLTSHIFLCQASSEKRIRIRLRGSQNELAVLWRFSLPSFLGGAMTGPILWLANTVLAHQHNGYIELGIFNAANQWKTAVGVLASIVCQPALSILSSVYGTGNLAAFRRAVHGTVLTVFACSVVPALGVLAAGRWILRGYGPQFSAGIAVLGLLAVTSVISSTAMAIGQAVASLDKMWAGFLLNLVWACAFLAFTVWLVPKEGAQGLALAMLLSYVIHAVSVGLYTRMAVMRT